MLYSISRVELSLTVFWHSALLACIHGAAVNDGKERGRVEETEGEDVTRVIDQTQRHDEERILL